MMSGTPRFSAGSLPHALLKIQAPRRRHSLTAWPLRTLLAGDEYFLCLTAGHAGLAELLSSRGESACRNPSGNTAGSFTILLLALCALPGLW
jgi:hypothetical protein